MAAQSEISLWWVVNIFIQAFNSCVVSTLARSCRGIRIRVSRSRAKILIHLHFDPCTAPHLVIHLLNPFATRSLIDFALICHWIAYRIYFGSMRSCLTMFQPANGKLGDDCHVEKLHASDTNPNEMAISKSEAQKYSTTYICVHWTLNS